MRAQNFIAGRLRFKGKVAIAAIAISFFVIIVSVSISEGFRREILGGLSDLGGDVQITASSLNLFDEQNPVLSDGDYVESIDSLPGVGEVRPVVYRYGILKGEESIQGVLFKGVENCDSVSMGIEVPRMLSSSLKLKCGDEIPAYFIGERLKARKFKVTRIYDAMVESADKLVVLARIQDLQSVARWKENEVSALEVIIDESERDRVDSRSLAWTIEEISGMMSRSLVERYSSLFEWLRVVEGNVLAILFLMIVVAAFNMMSGLLIMLFRSISTIGILKSMGMNDRKISQVFLMMSARAVAIGLLVGNAAALLFCFLQDKFHILRLDASNYFVPFVPVAVDLPSILVADVIAFVGILLFLLLPLKFISGVDPARTVKSL